MKIISLIRKVKIRALKDYGLVILGSLILALAYTLFIVPHNIVPGGVLGISIIINRVTGLSIGMIALCINIPLLIWGSNVLGKRTGVKTALSMILMSLFIDLINAMIQHKVVIDDILVSSVFGGIFIAIAIITVMAGGATTGGNDILVRIITKKSNIPYSQLILVVNGLVVIAGIFVFGDPTLAAYCIIAIFSVSKTLEYLLKKSGQNKTLLVFSEKNKSIKAAFLADSNKLNKSVQLIHQDSDQKLILITKNNKKLTDIERAIYNVDDKAKVIALESSIGIGV